MTAAMADLLEQITEAVATVSRRGDPILRRRCIEARSAACPCNLQTWHSTRGSFRRSVFVRRFDGDSSVTRPRCRRGSPNHFVGSTRRRVARGRAVRVAPTG
jgi:hypothetical protein